MTRVILSATALLIVLGALLAAELRAAHPAYGAPCPARPRHARPQAFHLTPGLEEHESWIEFHVPEPDATEFALCLDGRLWALGIGHTPENGLVRTSVNTTFVNVEWVLGRLAEFEVPTRWELSYTTYSLLQS